MDYRLTATDILSAWETGAARRPLDRALCILWAAGASTEVEPADLPLAERDRHLLLIRAETFGSRLNARASCPECGAELEMDLDARLLADALPATHNTAETDDELRPLTSRDLAAVCDLPAESLTAALRERLARPAASAAEAAVLERRIEAQAQTTELSTLLHCADCGAQWRETLDVTEHVWADIELAAWRLLAEVAQLAAAYGWSEAEILSLSPARRRVYLNQVRQP